MLHRARFSYKFGAVVLTVLLLGIISGRVLADDGATDSRAVFESGARDTDIANVPVVSWRDLPFETVKRQSYDYSCGAAAVATLMTYVYGIKTSEREVTKIMFDQGDQDKIRREGFSLLDMSNYINAHGLRANGYKINYDAIKLNKLPLIALINKNGYNHFVVIKGERDGYVLVGDPNEGNVIYPRNQFEKMWNGIVLVVTNKAHKGYAAFNNPREWELVRASARPRGIEHDPNNYLKQTLVNQTPYQIAPVGIDLLGVTNSVATTIH